MFKLIVISWCYKKLCIHQKCVPFVVICKMIDNMTYKKSCNRFEKFEKKCKYSKAKILGTLVCLSGAMAMSFLQSPPPTSPQINKPHLNENSNNYGYYDWMLGCFYLLGGVLTLSCNSVLQVDPLYN
jgi:hypothetical protein